jgi:sporulation protein YlmC with PRC-barrel domain
MIMQKRNSIAALAIVGLTVASTNLLAQDHAATPPQPAEPGQNYKTGAEPSPNPAPPVQIGHDVKHTEPGAMSVAPACEQVSHIIGMDVRTDAGEHLGKVQDVIVSLDSERAPFAVVRYGGALGVGGTRIAVPFKDLKLAEDLKMLTLATTKYQFGSASETPSGAWAAVASQDWAKNIDRFYGQPSDMRLSRFERHAVEPGQEGREFVRTPAETKDASVLLNQKPAAEQAPKDLEIKPTDGDITAQVSKLIEQTLGATASQDIQATVDKGVVTLKGSVAAPELQQKLDDQLKAIPGVERVDDRLTTSAKKD